MELLNKEINAASLADTVTGMLPKLQKGLFTCIVKQVVEAIEKTGDET